MLPCSAPCARCPLTRLLFDPPARKGHRLLTIAINLLILPLLPLVPDEMEERMHAHALRAIKEGLPSPYVVWVLPAGRLALWFVSTLLLGLQLTFSPTSLISLHHKSGNEQADRVLYALAVAESLQVRRAAR